MLDSLFGQTCLAALDYIDYFVSSRIELSELRGCILEVRSPRTVFFGFFFILFSAPIGFETTEASQRRLA